MSSEYTVHLINPRKADMADTNPRKRRRRKGTTARKPRRRRRRTSNPEQTTAYVPETNRRRRRKRGRSRNPSPGRRIARRAGRIGLLGLGALGADLRDAWPRFLGKLWVAWAVRRWGAQFGGGGLFGTPQTSPTAGESWTLGQYFIGYLALTVGSNFFGRWVSPAQFRQGGIDLLFTKLAWTEGIARSQWAQTQFGAATYGQAEGDVQQTPDGQTWLQQGGQWVALQGQLVQSSPLDGALVSASPLDGAGSYGMGHQLTPETDPALAIAAHYQRTGARSPYAAPYLAGAI
jgi:hypothetical protein